MFKTTKIKILIPSILVLTLAGCGSEPEWVAVYEQCKETVQVESKKITATGADSADEQNSAMIESMNNMAINMAMSSCEMIRASCEEDADSATCRAYVGQRKQR